MKQYLYFNPKLKERVKNLRKNQTPFEKKFWYDALHEENIKKFKWIRQKPIDNYIVDFFCFELMLAREIDGETHIDEVYENKRTAKLEEYKIKIIRYTNKEISDNFFGVSKDLMLKIKDRIEELKRLNPLSTS